ncbi:VCBS domain-containing protein [Bradyrhizobium stylosanthis]|uniref:VCBS repeat-containing protein n=1 Tax=Bradyrhizobium stylosanthis TaxID=1803665 RepID=A0A560DMW2_9BRAD|nr:VCBS domain-containing protein [Bradyrhizobium stylosanthis]TWA98454.1 VCBS repeat-containing protein [Bradyrhizobium stylosanthis]
MSVAFGVGPQNWGIRSFPLQIIGIVQSTLGCVTLTRDDGPAMQVSIGDLVCRRDVIETAADAQVGIRLLDDTVFNIASGARVELREFASDSDAASRSTIVTITSGSFAFAAGRLAEGGTLTIDTPLGSVRSRSQATGFGILTMAALTFAMVDQARGADPDGASLDNDTLTYKDLQHGVFELITKERVPRHIIVDDPGETVVLNRIGSSISVNQVTNSAARMDELHAAQQDVLANLTRGPIGSSTPPFVETLSLQHINFTSENTTAAPNLLPNAPPVVFPPIEVPLPTLKLPAGPVEIDTFRFDDKFATTSGTFTASNPFNNTLTYGLAGGTAGTTVLNGETYDLSQNSPYGTLYLNSASGAYTFVPNAFAINALLSPTTTSFVITVSDGFVSTSQSFVITINGVNDTAIISGNAEGTVVEAGGVANAVPGTPSATGMLTDADVDNPPNTFTTVSSPARSTGGYGTFTMTAGGVWTYTLDDSNTAVQSLNAGDTLIDRFTVTSIDGTPQVVTIAIQGSNDAAIVSGVTAGSVFEAGVTLPGTPVATGTLFARDVDNLADTFVEVNAPTASAQAYGSFTVTTAGVWTYTLDNTNAAVQALNSGDTLTDSFTVTTIDGTPQIVTITISGSNDGAVVSGTKTGAVTEAGGVANGTPGTPTASGTLTDIDPDNTANTFTPVITPKPSAGGFGTFTITALGTWTYSLDDGNATVQALNAGDTLIDQFTVTTVDGTPQTVTITIHGANDAAIISGTAAGAVLEAGVITSGTPVATGTLTDTDVDNPADTFTAVISPTSSNGGYGTFTMTASGLWTYTLDNTNNAVQALNNGNTLTDSFTVTAADGTPQTVTITINGSNDSAVISGTATGAVTEAGGVANATPGQPTTTGTLTDVDPDNTANTFTPVTTPRPSAGGFGTFTMTALGTWTYTLDNTNAAVQALNVGDTLTDQFTVTTVDGTAKLVTITINGSNDAAIISGTTTGSVLEAGGIDPGTPVASGTLTDTDVDNLANTFTPVTSPTASDGGYGTFTMTASGLWTYTLDNNNGVVDALGPGDTLTDHFTVTSIDGTTQEVAITIHGASDADPNDFDNLALGSTVVSDPPFVYGTPGGDSVAGGGSISQIIYGGAGGDTLNGTGVNDVIYGGSGDDTIKGNNGDDVIYGGSGQDTIDGSNGNDTIIGGFGADKLQGGNGADVFTYLSVLDSRAGRFDTIEDFRSGTDKIDLTALGALGFVILALSSASSSVPPHTIAWLYDSSANETIVYVNPTDQTLQIGDSGLLEVHLQGVATIDSADFIVDQAAAPVMAVSDTLDPAAAVQSDALVTTLGTSDVSTAATNSGGAVSLDSGWTAPDASFLFEADRDHGGRSHEIAASAPDEIATAASNPEPAIHSLSIENFKFVFEPSQTEDGIHANGIGATGMPEQTHAAAFSVPDALPAIDPHLGDGKSAEAHDRGNPTDIGSARDAAPENGHVNGQENGQANDHANDHANGGDAHSNSSQAGEHGHASVEAPDAPKNQGHSAADGPPGQHGNSQAHPPGRGDSFNFATPAVETPGIAFIDDHPAPHDPHGVAAHGNGHDDVALAGDVAHSVDHTHIPGGMGASHVPHDFLV